MAAAMEIGEPPPVVVQNQSFTIRR